MKININSINVQELSSDSFRNSERIKVKNNRKKVQYSCTKQEKKPYISKVKTKKKSPKWDF